MVKIEYGLWIITDCINEGGLPLTDKSFRKQLICMCVCVYKCIGVYVRKQMKQNTDD